jgi:DNA-binding transcriptional regulator YiaG
LNRLAKEHLREGEKKELKLDATPEELKASRLTPDRIRGLRKKLGISMRELGILTESTVGSVLSWEKGTFKPRGDKKVALVALRKMRKRDVKKVLAEKTEVKAKTKEKGPEVRNRGKKAGKRPTRRRK